MDGLDLYCSLLCKVGMLAFPLWMMYRLIRVPVISQMRLWAIYRSKKVLYAMTVLIVLGLAAMGAIEGLGYKDFQGA